MKSEALHFVTEQYLIKSQYQNNSILNFENISLPPALKGYYLKLLLTSVRIGSTSSSWIRTENNIIYKVH